LILACAGALLGCNVGLADLGIGTAPTPPPTRRVIITQPPATPAAPAPTAEPQPSPAVVGKPTSFAAFRKHVNRSIKEAKPIFGNKSRIRNAGPAELTRLISRGSDWADEELEWLSRHSPRECYASFFEGWKSAIAIAAEGLSAMETGLANEDVDEAMRGLRLLESMPDFRATGAIAPITCGR
jgi:hypothetical protein